MTIRGRLLWLTLGLLVPLVLIGFFNLRGFRQASRTQINESLERQAQFAATAFEQRILAQRRTLETISILANNNESRFALRAYLDSIVRTRPNWLEVQIVNAAGKVVLAQTNKNLGFRAGVDVYLTKPFEPDELVAVIKNIVERVERTHSTIARLVGKEETAETVFVRDEELTEAEWRVAESVARGLSNKEIAAELHLSIRTVENHVSRILAKKNFHNRVEIARYVLAAGVKE